MLVESVKGHNSNVEGGCVHNSQMNGWQFNICLIIKCLYICFCRIIRDWCLYIQNKKVNIEIWLIIFHCISHYTVLYIYINCWIQNRWYSIYFRVLSPWAFFPAYISTIPLAFLFYRTALIIQRNSLVFLIHSMFF